MLFIVVATSHLHWLLAPYFIRGLVKIFLLLAYASTHGLRTYVASATTSSVRIAALACRQHLVMRMKKERALKVKEDLLVFFLFSCALLNIAIEMQHGTNASARSREHVTHFEGFRKETQLCVK